MRSCLVLLAVLGLSAGNILFRDPPPSTSVALRFSDPELSCLLKQKVLHSDGKCYRLKQKGPCENGHWLVLDSAAPQNSRKLACKSLPCDQPLRVFWPSDGQCHKHKDKDQLCPYKDNELKSDSYGDGECACVKVHARLDTDILRGQNTTAEWEGDCHALYQRGPCPADKVLMPVYMEGYGVVGKCSPDPCSRENGVSPSAWFAKHPPNGRCYQLGTRGPCAANEIFDVYHLSNKPRCFDPRSVEPLSLYGDSAMRCAGNINAMTMECREELTVNVELNPLVSEVTAPRRRSRRG